MTPYSFKLVKEGIRCSFSKHLMYHYALFLPSYFSVFVVISWYYLFSCSCLQLREYSFYQQIFGSKKGWYFFVWILFRFSPSAAAPSSLYLSCPHEWWMQKRKSYSGYWLLRQFVETSNWSTLSSSFNYFLDCCEILSIRLIVWFARVALAKKIFNKSSDSQISSL